MKNKIVIDYITGPDVITLVDRYSISNGMLVVDELNKTVVYPLYEVRSLTITVEQ